MSSSIQVAITRRVRPGCEADFQHALRDFLQSSFAFSGVNGASMLVPPPGSDSTEFGILRTFASEEERDAFYESPMFKAWQEQVKPLTEGEALHRELHGLDAWFRGDLNPPRWKMALLTWIAVWPVSMAVPALLAPALAQRLSSVLFAGAVAAGIVVILTWLAMPILIFIAKPWLNPKR
jgi:uncharacterized protein